MTLLLRLLVALLAVAPFASAASASDESVVVAVAVDGSIGEAAPPSSSEPPVTLTEMKTVMKELLGDFKADIKADIKADLDSFKAEIKADIKADLDSFKADIKTDVTIRMDGFESRFNARIDSLAVTTNAIKTDVGTLKTDVSTLETDVGTLKTDVADLSSSVITPRKLRDAERCSAGVTVLVSSSFEGMSTWTTCSGVPVPHPLLMRANGSGSDALAAAQLAPSSVSTFFYTAGHCIYHLNATGSVLPTKRLQTEVRHNNVGYPCDVWAEHYHAEKLVDIAILHCRYPVPIPSPALFPSSLPITHELVILSGFSTGMTLKMGTTEKSFIMHTHIVHDSESIRTQDPAFISPHASSPSTQTTGSGGAESTSSSASVSPHPYSLQDVAEVRRLQTLNLLSRGFLDKAPVTGESGGPVLSLSCELLGVAVSRSASGDEGLYIRLSPAMQTQTVQDLEKGRRPAQSDRG